MKRFLIITSVLALLVLGCSKEPEYAEAEEFSFIVYPGARYLGELTEITRQAHKLVKPNQEPPPVAIYDTEA